MARPAFINARIDSTTKEATECVLSDFGLTPTEAIRLFYRQIAMRGEFPLELRVPNSNSAAVLSEADQGKGLETFCSTDDLYASWNS